METIQDELDFNYQKAIKQEEIERKELKRKRNVEESMEDDCSEDDGGDNVVVSGEELFTFLAKSWLEQEGPKILIALVNKNNGVPIKSSLSNSQYDAVQAGCLKRTKSQKNLTQKSK